jgi:hypothetical protein
VNNSQANEVGCGKYAPTPAPTPAPPAPTPRSDCKWAANMGQYGSDITPVRTAASKEECCGWCWANAECTAADFTKAGKCHLKGTNKPVVRDDGSVSCVPLKDREQAREHWAKFD